MMGNSCISNGKANLDRDLIVDFESKSVNVTTRNENKIANFSCFM